MSCYSRNRSKCYFQVSYRKASLPSDKCLLLLTRVCHPDDIFMWERVCKSAQSHGTISRRSASWRQGNAFRNRVKYFDFCFIVEKWYLKNTMICFSTESFCWIEGSLEILNDGTRTKCVIKAKGEIFYSAKNKSKEYLTLHRPGLNVCVISEISELQ